MAERKKTVLVVDDEPDVVTFLSTLLEGRAWMVSLPAILRQSLISFGPSDFTGLEAVPWMALVFVLVAVVGMWKHPGPASRWGFSWAASMHLM